MGPSVQIIDQRRGGAAIETEEVRGPDGIAVIRAIVRDEVSRGQAGKSIGNRYNLKPPTVRT